MNILKKELYHKYSAPLAQDGRVIKSQIMAIIKKETPELKAKVSISNRAWLEDASIEIFGDNLYKSYFEISHAAFWDSKLWGCFRSNIIKSWDTRHDCRVYYYLINQSQNFYNVKTLLKDKYAAILNLIYRKLLSGRFEPFQINIHITPAPANWGGWSPSKYAPDKHASAIISFYKNKHERTIYKTGREYNMAREWRRREARRALIKPERIEESAEIVRGCVFPLMNKNCTLKEYTDQLRGGRLETCAALISKKIYLNKDDFEVFKYSLLDDFGFISGGGVGFINKDNKIMDVNFEEARAAGYDCIRDCLLVNDCLLVDPSGHKYARYVGFLPNSEYLAGAR